MCLLYVLGEFGFGIRRPGNEDGPGVAERRADAFQEFLVDRRMATVAGIGLMMNVLIRMRAANAAAFCVGGVELKHPGFAMIYPDQRMVVVSHARTPDCRQKSHSVQELVGDKWLAGGRTTRYFAV